MSVRESKMGPVRTCRALRPRQWRHWVSIRLQRPQLSGRDSTGAEWSHLPKQVPAGQGLSSPWPWGLASTPDLPTAGQAQPAVFPRKSNTPSGSNRAGTHLTQDRREATSPGCQVGGPDSCPSPGVVVMTLSFPLKDACSLVTAPSLLK